MFFKSMISAVVGGVIGICISAFVQPKSDFELFMDLQKNYIKKECKDDKACFDEEMASTAQWYVQHANKKNN